jgi:hypothetical protein
VTTIEVRTQSELDAALDAAKAYDIIAIVGGSWLEVSRLPKSDSATVTASDSATVGASGSATVRAYGSATVRAYDSATVTASDSATVTAAKFVAVHRRSRGATLTGGVQIDPGDIDTAEAWCEYHGVPVVDGIATLHKAVDDDWSTDNARRKRIAYVPGATVDAKDWKPTKACGNGLHACAHPHQALGYNEGATRFVAVTAPVASLVIIDDGKVKAPRFTVAGEVDIDGQPKATPASDLPAPKAKRTPKAAGS